MVGKWVISPQYTPFINRWNNPFTNHLQTSWDIQAWVWGWEHLGSHEKANLCVVAEFDGDRDTLDIQNPPHTWWIGVSLEPLKPQEMWKGVQTSILARYLDV